MTRLQLLPLLLSLLAASAAAQAPGTTILDQGRLEYRLRGEPCGHEDFVVEEGEGRITWRSSSRLELRAPDGRSLTVEIDVRAVYAGEGGRPRTLLSIREDIRTSEIAGKPIQIWGQFTRPRDSQLIIEQPDPGMASRLVLPVVFDPDGSLTPPRERGRPRPQGEWTGDESPLEPLVVIDSNGGYALYGAAARMASRAYGRVERVYAIVPQADKSAGVASELAVSLEAQQGRGAQGEARDRRAGVPGAPGRGGTPREGQRAAAGVRSRPDRRPRPGRSGELRRGSRGGRRGASRRGLDGHRPVFQRAPLQRERARRGTSHAAGQRAAFGARTARGAAPLRGRSARPRWQRAPLARDRPRTLQ